MRILLIILNGAITEESIVIAIVGYLVVFAALVLLFWCFNTIPKILYYKRGKRRKTEGDLSKEKMELAIAGETTAAMAMALSLYLSEMHDEESGIITIKKVSKTYSPWSSKIYAVRNQFNRS